MMADMTNRPIHVDMQELHRIHATRMSAWGLPSGDIYESDVVNRVVDWVRGIDDEPISHPHAQKEMGACLECDAAAIVAALNQPQTGPEAGGTSRRGWDRYGR